MLEGGEDPRFIARRMVILASEDIGNADPQALSVAVAAAHAVEHVGMPEACLRARAGGDLPRRWRRSPTRPARRSAAPAPTSASTAPRRRPTRCAAPPTPAPRTARPRQGYDYPHDRPGHVSPAELMPPGLEGTTLLRARRCRGRRWRRAWKRSGGRADAPRAEGTAAPAANAGCRCSGTENGSLDNPPRRRARTPALPAPVRPCAPARAAVPPGARGRRPRRQPHLALPPARPHGDLRIGVRRQPRGAGRLRREASATPTRPTWCWSTSPPRRACGGCWKAPRAPTPRATSPRRPGLTSSPAMAVATETPRAPGVGQPGHGRGARSRPATPASEIAAAVDGSAAVQKLWAQLRPRTARATWRGRRRR